MPQLLSAERPVAGGTGRRGARRWGTMAWAVALQGAFLAATLYIIVLDTPEPEPVVFEGKQSYEARVDPAPQQRARDRFLRSMSKPRLVRPLALDSAVDGLPALPRMAADAFVEDGLSEELLGDAAGFLESSGLLAGVADSASSAEFFGVRDSGKRIVIVVNTSASVVRKARSKGLSIEAIQAEAIKLIEGLESGAMFGIVQFSQGTRSFADQLAPAIGPNKKAAADWVGGTLKGNPPVLDEALAGHEGGLAAAFALEPDLVFLVTDGVLNKRTRSGNGYAYPEISYDALIGFSKRESDRRGLRMKAHVIGFELDEESRRGLERWTKGFGGTVREF